MRQDGVCHKLPFAGQYLKETWFKGPFSTLWIANELSIQPCPTPKSVTLSEDGRTITVENRSKL